MEHNHDSLMEAYVTLQNYNCDLRKTIENLQHNERELASAIQSQQDIIDNLNNKINELELIKRIYREIILGTLSNTKVIL